MTDGEHTVSAAAELAGVSVRTLRCAFSARSARGEVASKPVSSPSPEKSLNRCDFSGPRLQRPARPRTYRSYRQRELLTDRIARFTAMLAVIDEELAARKAGIGLTPQQRREVFGDNDFVAHAEEARQTWGDTTEFAQRRERTAHYTQQDWEKLRAELAAINQGLAEAMLAGVPATDPIALDLAERHRKHTDRWFHDCDHATHRGLAEHYRANDRRGKNYDDMVPGLSQYVHDAIVANAEAST